MYLLFVNLTAIGLFLAAFVDNIGHFLLFFNMLNLVIMMTAGISYPNFVMPSGLVNAVKCIWPFTHAAIPLKYLNLKGVGLESLLPYIKDGLLYTAFWLPVGIAMYSARILLKKHKNNMFNQKEASKDNLIDIKEDLKLQLD
jgi:ABC-2 type transport system permease protein